MLHPGGVEAGKPFHALGNGGVGNSGHVAAGEFPVREEGAIEVGHVDGLENFFDSGFPAGPLVDIREIENGA